VKIDTRHHTAFVLLGGCLSFVVVPLLLQLPFFFWPHWSSLLAYFLVGVAAWLARPQERRFVFIASIVLSVVGLFIFIDPQTRCIIFPWSIYGLILDYVMPLATLSIALPVFTVLLARRLRGYSVDHAA
jgi:hypothetical protein